MMAELCYPTNGELIELLQEFPDSTSLHLAFSVRYPHIKVPRADRFFQTVSRIYAPFTSSRPLKINPEEYKARIWKPRVRNFLKGSTEYPEILLHYGLTEDHLFQVLKNSLDGEHVWKIPSDCPKNLIYLELHNYLKHLKANYTKIAIGNLYMQIDEDLLQRGFRSDNAYKYIDRLVSHLDMQHTPTGQDVQTAGDQDIDHTPTGQDMQTAVDEYVSVSTFDTVLVECSLVSDEPPCFSDTRYLKRNVERREKRKEHQISVLKSKIKEKNTEIKCLDKVKRSTDLKEGDYRNTMSTLTSKLNELSSANDRYEKHEVAYENKIKKLQKKLDTVLSDFEALELAMDTIQEENECLRTAVKVQESLSTNTNTSVSIQTKQGRHYTPEIRKLYYDLLSNQVPASRIRHIVSSVLESFMPERTIELPKERCAGYMRRQELKTIALAQKAHLLCDEIKSGRPLHLNSDGTTKSQHKINGVAVNGIVISVNEVSDGTAKTLIEDIDSELIKLREVAKQLHIPNAESINWTLFQSSSSDSASTQKKMNKLLEERKDIDQQKFGTFDGGGIELIQNFCAMHLGVNLRSAFVQAISPKDTEGSRHSTLDSFVHSFCKEFGSHGTPEYGAGSVKFPDFIDMQGKSDIQDSQYYRDCVKVRLERQIGSRYFVTASNSSKILYLAVAAIAFLEFNGLNETSGNKLERDVYTQLHDSSLMLLLKADSLMFYHIYADLTTLAKSKHLEKSAYDMATHYLELKIFLEEIEDHPEIVLNRNHPVFVSEKRLYCDKAVNHRETHKQVWDRLFQEDVFDDDMLSTIRCGAESMKNKLVSYASSQLPGGEYWDPEPDIKAVLVSIKPTNDICESILGLNDYLTTSIPNMDQLTRGNMVVTKKNKTVNWLKSLPLSQQDDLTLYAMHKRNDIAAEFSKEQMTIKDRRQELMLRAKNRREALAKKALEERERLSKVHVISSVEELESIFADIDSGEGRMTTKNNKKISCCEGTSKSKEKGAETKCCNQLYSTWEKEISVCDC